MVQAFVANDVLRSENTVLDTGFFTKGGASITPDEIRLIDLPAYRGLVFAEITPPRTLRSLVRDHVPGAARLYRLVRATVNPRGSIAIPLAGKVVTKLR